MKRIIVTGRFTIGISIAAGLFLLLGALAAPGRAQGLDTSTVGLRIVQQRADGFEMEFIVPPYRLKANGDFSEVSASGLIPNAPPGFPRLPVTGTLIGLPPRGEAIVSIVEDHQEIQPLDQPMAAWQPTRGALPDTLASAQEAGARIQALPLQKDGLYPQAPVVIEPAGFLRSQRLARLVIAPFQYDPQRRQLIVHTRIRFSVRFTEIPAQASSTQIAEPEPVEDVLRAVLLNYDQARLWRVPPEAAPLPEIARSASAAATSVRYKIPIDHDGIYRITYDQLASWGLPVDTLDPRTISISSQGREIAIRVSGEEDGHLDPADYIEFYGQAFHGDIEDTQYTGTNIYWLSYGGAPGKRMVSVNGAPQGKATPTSFRDTIHAEENTFWWTLETKTPDVKDTWFWERVVVGGKATSVSKTYAITVPFPAPVTETVQVTVEVRARSQSPELDPDHLTRVFLNGTQVQEVTWDGSHSIQITATVSPTQLVSGANQVTLEFVRLPGVAVEDMFPNWIEVSYPRAYRAYQDTLLFHADAPGTWDFQITDFTQPDLYLYDITDPGEPKRITAFQVITETHRYTLRTGLTTEAGSRFLAVAASAIRAPDTAQPVSPSAIRSPTQGADHILIIDEEFRPAAERLAAFHRSRGQRVAIVNVQEIYNEFYDGIRHPRAIRDFLAYAYANWQPPAPLFVTLLGDAHANLRNYNPTVYLTIPIRIPPYLVWEDPWLGQAPADNAFVTIVGDDPLPDMIIGRIAVNTLEEAQGVVDKILSYSSQPPAPWQQRALMAADNPDEAGNFPVLSDALITGEIPSYISVTRAYLGQTHATGEEVTSAITRAINHGVLFVTWTGHGAMDLWANEAVWRSSYVPQLHNKDRYPFVTTFNCFDGAFIAPWKNRYLSIAEAMSIAAERGSIANWSPTGLGLAHIEHILARGFYHALFSDGIRQIGPATVKAKLTLYASVGDDSLLHTMTLFGDPALVLALPRWVPGIYMPLIQHQSP